MLRPRPLIPLLATLTLFGSVTSRAQDKPPAAGETKPAEQSPAAPATPATPKPAQQPFGEEVNLASKTVVYFKGSGKWDSAFETIVDGFKSVNGFLSKAGLQPSGSPMTIYTATDDDGFQFQAAVPVAEAPKDPPKGDLSVGKTPEGKAYKFVHRGSYDSMDTTYEAITNFLDEKGIDAKELFVEQYLTDPLTTPEDKLVVEIYVPIK